MNEWINNKVNMYVCIYVCIFIFIFQIIFKIWQYERVNALTTKPQGFKSVSGTPDSLFFNKQESNPLKKDTEEVERYLHL